MHYDTKILKQYRRYSSLSVLKQFRIAFQYEESETKFAPSVYPIQDKKKFHSIRIYIICKLSKPLYFSFYFKLSKIKGE